MVGKKLKDGEEVGGGELRRVGSSREARPSEAARLLGPAKAGSEMGVHQPIAHFTSPDANNQNKGICKMLWVGEGRGRLSP